jgi:hypothetical protein
MQTYAEFCPTSFDNHIWLSEREQWIVAPVSINRDTGCPIELSNWESVQSMLDDAGIEYEIHRFGHWANGWFEIILVDPAGAHIIEGIESRLEDYLILDEDDASSKEWDQRCEDWENYGRADFTNALRKLAGSWFYVRNVCEDESFYLESSCTHCHETGLHRELCWCGSCLLTESEAQTILLDWLDNAETETIDQIAESHEKETYHNGSGTVFRHDITLAQLIEHCPELK